MKQRLADYWSPEKGSKDRWLRESTEGGGMEESNAEATDDYQCFYEVLVFIFNLLLSAGIGCQPSG
jgi:hypothetical protein